MAKQDIPADVRRFVLAHIPSIPHLEALMLLRAAAPKGWSADALAPRLYVNQAKAAAVLDALARAGILRSDQTSGAFHYSDAADARTAVIDQLATLYGTHLVEVTRLIHSTRADP